MVDYVGRRSVTPSAAEPLATSETADDGGRVVNPAVTLG